MEEEKELKQIEVTLTYPYSSDYEFLSKIEVIDLDKEAKEDIQSGNGFLISSPKSTIKKELKSIDGIYSSRFGQKLGDVNPYGDRYSCECGYMRFRFNRNITCPRCGTKVKFIDDNFKMFGWIVLKDEYHIIHPKFYETLDYIFGPSQYNIERKKIKGTKLQNMLNYSPEIDQDGFDHPCKFKPNNEPFYGIGMIEFYERFDEILDYYYQKNQKKKEYVDEILEYRDMVFCHSIPVFTTHLRPAEIRDGFMYHELCNGMYNIINQQVARINNNKRVMNQNRNLKAKQLFKVQSKFMELTNEIMNILTGKKGTLRSLVGGRYNYSSRCVIRQDPSLRVDQVKLPYVELVKCCQQVIINILCRTYNISPAEAYTIWSKALANKDNRICEILNSLINATPEGIPVIINRNPSMETLS